MQILRAGQYQRMPWKNGGGETLEIAISPLQASFDTLDWRISMALVTQDGPFSMLPQIDRTLCVLDGPGLDLDFGADGGIQRVTPATPPLSFPADRAVHARVLGGPVTDLNVMTRRGRYRHTVRRTTLTSAEKSFTSDADQLLLFCEHGQARLTLADQNHGELSARDGVLLGKGRAALSFVLSAQKSEVTSICLIELSRVAA